MSLGVVEEVPDDSRQRVPVALDPGVVGDSDLYRQSAGSCSDGRCLGGQVDRVAARWSRLAACEQEEVGDEVLEAGELAQRVRGVVVAGFVGAGFPGAERRSPEL